MTSKQVVGKEELVRLQEKNSTLQKFKEAKRIDARKRHRISYKECGGIWYRKRQRKGEVGDTRKQILVPKSLRAKVMKEVHDSLFGGPLGVKKTAVRILINFFRPGLHHGVTNFCRLCDACQKTVPRRSVPRAILGDIHH